MRRGFVVPLVVAFFLAVSQGFALAPLISCIPDVIVSDAEQNTLTGDRNFFIYSNALDLDEIVTDGDTTISMLKWCFLETTPASIQINGKASYAGPNFKDPGASNIRAVSRYATLRNVKWSPLSGTMPFPDPGVASMGSTLQMYVSDGTTVDSQTVLVTTVNTATSAGQKDRLVMQSLKSYPFTAGSEGWTWYQQSGGGIYPATGQASGGNLSIQETAAQVPIVFGSWESPRDPAVSLHSSFGCVLRARFQVRSSADGPLVPGFRMRAIWTRVVQSGGAWNVDFLNPDTNDNYEVMNTGIYIPAGNVGVLGREPGVAGKVYTALFYPQQIDSLQSTSAVTYITYDLVDVDTFADHSGTLYVDQVDVDGMDRPATNSSLATAVPGLTYTTGFTGWVAQVASIGAGSSLPAAPAIGADIAITVASANKLFEVSVVSPGGTALESGRYYRSIFTVTSTQASGNIGPTIRAGYASSRMTYSVNKDLGGGGTWSQIGPTPTEFEVWIEAPTPWPQAGTLTEPIQLRFESYLTANPHPIFNKPIAGTLRCTRVVTQMFPAP